MKMNLSYPLMTLLLVASTGRGDEKALDLFQQRIMPIFRSENPSSCIQCHLSSVDLKDYILPSHEQTFAALREQGLIDLTNPEDSKILDLIRMGDKDSDLLAKRIHSRTRKAELEAFAAWIEACCKDEKLVALPVADVIAGPEASDEVIRHNRKDRVLDSFVRNVWSQRMRCFPCHTPGELDPENPRHKKPIQNHRQLVAKYGQRMNLFRATPEATLRGLIASTRRRSEKHVPLLNLEDPARSLLILKPTSKLPPKGDDGQFLPPSSTDPVSHMGGLKMHKDDQSYKAIVAWIEDFARVTKDQYDSADGLPADDWFPTKHVLRVKGTPESWPVGTPVQLLVQSWDESNERWNDDPIAFTQGTVTPRHFVNGMLFLFGRDAAQDESEIARIPAGKYRVQAYLDRNGQLDKNPTVFLGQDDFVGHAVIAAQWREGFPGAQVVPGDVFVTE